MPQGGHWGARQFVANFIVSLKHTLAPYFWLYIDWARSICPTEVISWWSRPGRQNRGFLDHNHRQQLRCHWLGTRSSKDWLFQSHSDLFSRWCTIIMSCYCGDQMRYLKDLETSQEGVNIDRKCTAMGAWFFGDDVENRFAYQGRVILGSFWDWQIIYLL